MPSPTAAPTVSSTVGLKNLVIAPVTADTEESTTYGDLQKVAGAIEATITPENNDPDVQYFDDTEGDVLYPDPELSFTTRLADLPLVIQEMIFGNQIDDNGVLVRTATDKPPYFAVGFMSTKIRRPSRSSSWGRTGPKFRWTSPKPERPAERIRPNRRSRIPQIRICPTSTAWRRRNHEPDQTNRNLPAGAFDGAHQHGARLVFGRRGRSAPAHGADGNTAAQER